MNELLLWVKKHKYFLISFLINIILCLCLMINCRGGEPTIDIQYIPVHDTITINKERIINHTDTIHVRDTLIKIDSFIALNGDTFAVMPMQYKEYNDTIKTDSTEARIDIEYHGIYASIDRVSLDYRYNKEIQTITKPAKRVGIVWFVGPAIGYGFHGSVNNGTFGHGPNVSINVGIGLGGQIEIKKKR